MKICGKTYHNEQGNVLECTEDTPCRGCLVVEIQRQKWALEAAGERAASLERVIRHLRDGDSVMEESR